MAKFYGIVGFAKEVGDDGHGVWKPSIEERPYYGDVTRDIRKFSNSDKVNGDLDVSNEISIVADPFAYDHFSAIRYVIFGGAKWKVSSVEVQRPRLRLTIGGLYEPSV